MTFIYDSNITGSWLWDTILGSGDGFAINSDATRDNLQWRYTQQTIAADSYTFNETWAANGSGSEGIPFDNAAIFSQNVAIPDASISGNNSPLVAFGSDSGLAISHAKRNDNTNGLTFVIDTRANWPAWSATADSLGWPFEGVNDTINVWSKKLTRAGTGAGVTYGAGVIGQAATLDGSANGYFTRYGDQSLRLGTANFTMLMWFKSTSSVTPPTIEELFCLTTTGSVNLQFRYQTTGQLFFYITDDGDATSDQITSPQNVYDTNWHYGGVVRVSNTAYMYLVVTNLFRPCVAIS